MGKFKVLNQCLNALSLKLSVSPSLGHFLINTSDVRLYTLSFEAH